MCSNEQPDPGVCQEVAEEVGHERTRISDREAEGDY